MKRWISGLLLTLIFITPLEAKAGKIPAAYQPERYPSQEMGTGKQFSRPFIDAAKKATPSIVTGKQIGRAHV